MLTKILLPLILNAGLLYGLAERIEGISYTGGITFLIIGAILITLINTVAKPIVKLLALPLIIISGGIVLIAINAGVLWFMSYFLDVAQFRDVTFTIATTESYVIGAIILGLFNTIVSAIK